MKIFIGVIFGIVVGLIIGSLGSKKESEPLPFADFRVKQEADDVHFEDYRSGLVVTSGENSFMISSGLKSIGAKIGQGREWGHFYFSELDGKGGFSTFVVDVNVDGEWDRKDK